MPELDTPDVAATPEGGASPDAVDSSSTQGATSPQTGASSADVTAQSSDQSTQEPPDPLSGVPTLEEAQQLQTVSREAFLSLRGEYDKVKPQLQDLSSKYQVFEPVADRFSSTDELQSLVTLNESLYKYSPDEKGVLVPDPEDFVKQISEKDPYLAEYLTGHLFWGTATDPQTGQTFQRSDKFLQVMAQDPEYRAKALQILGGVEPSSVPAPTWTPTEEELAVVKPELQDIYKKLPFDKRESLRLNDPDFINEYLDDQKFKAETRARDEQSEIRQREYIAQQEQRVEQEATTAGDQYVEQGFKEGFTNFANHIFETWKPTDNPVINKREGALVAATVVALSHPDTRFAIEQAFKDMGIDQKALDAFNAAREAYAKQGREHGYLTHKKMRTTGDPGRAQQRLIAQANNLATLITKGRDEYFTARATSFNGELDQAATARIPIGGNPQTSQQATGNRYLQAGKRTEAEIYGT